MLTLLPAVDVADGKAVRLLQGEVGSETDYGSPVDAARDWVRAGAEWIHLVDLDAAFGRGSNHELLSRIVGEVGIKVELSGGIRDDASLARALAPPESTWARRRWRIPRGPRGSLPSTVAGSPSASTCVGPLWLLAAGPRRAVTSGRHSSDSTPPAVHATSSPTSPATAP